MPARLWPAYRGLKLLSLPWFLLNLNCLWPAYRGLKLIFIPYKHPFSTSVCDPLIGDWNFVLRHFDYASFHSLWPAYRGLKHMTMCRLGGITDRLWPAYRGLKHKLEIENVKRVKGLWPAYRGLKLIRFNIRPAWALVCDPLIGDWNIFVSLFPNKHIRFVTRL